MDQSDYTQEQQNFISEHQNDYNEANNVVVNVNQEQQTLFIGNEPTMYDQFGHQPQYSISVSNAEVSRPAAVPVYKEIGIKKNQVFFFFIKLENREVKVYRVLLHLFIF